MITVTRYIDSDPSVVLRSNDVGAEQIPLAWENGGFVHLSVSGFEIAMPTAVWEQACREVRHAAENPPPRPTPLSVTGKNAADVRTVEVATFDDPTAPAVPVASHGQIFPMPDPYSPKAGA